MKKLDLIVVYLIEVDKQKSNIQEKEFSDTGSEELSKINCIEVDAIAGQ